ncbi:Uncharacterised protein [Mycobacteroides abscessus subsp. abscessus]|nr:Uncharacterised protein [Mycobacteroides abscessus subsp. abscessus]
MCVDHIGQQVCVDHIGQIHSPVQVLIGLHVAVAVMVAHLVVVVLLGEEPRGAQHDHR